ncbi:PTS sugar transporter subunit IIA [Lactiplantibacillus daowaiensis]|uniref:PTS sugar transporter subunit IIA n=1 Tax=Lactiplantibacillus daowaiensis TaxID=2559918 RepID=A0ABW1S1A7_9LACO|nr:PTS sugar transporter subunit IIA [Lactiplantibacillus daowaiensis]
MSTFVQTNVFTDIDCQSTKAAALTAFAGKISTTNALDKSALVQGFLAREAESTTGFGNGVAIPHTKITGISEPIVSVISFQHPVDWTSLDDQPVEIAIGLVMPQTGADQDHLKVLSKLARKLMDTDFIAALQAARHDASQLYQVIQSNVDLSH